MAQAESIADQIAFQVNEAYRNAVTSWVGEHRRCPPGRRSGQRELPARATAATRGCGHSHRDCRRASHADPRPAELSERSVWLSDRDGSPGICHGSRTDADDSGLQASLVNKQLKRAEEHMSTIQSAQPPSSNVHQATTAPGPRAARQGWFRPGRLLAMMAVIALVAIAFVPVMNWIEYRRDHSITDDVFVEAHIVNVAPQVVSGRLLRYFVDENDQVVQGQVVARARSPFLTETRSTSLSGYAAIGPGRAGPPACRPRPGSQTGAD